MNIYELAKKAGVSTATVSRVINNSSKVSEKTRKRILSIMEEENYIPSAFARGLSGSPARTVGIITIDIRDQYFASVIHSLEQELSLHQYNVILCNTGGEIEEQRNYINLLLQKKVEAIVLVGSVFRNPQLKGAISQVTGSVPVIIANEKVEGDNIYSIICNEGKGIKEAVIKLHNKGYENFAYVKVGGTYSAGRKLQGFYDAVKEITLPEENAKVFHTDRELECAYSIADEIIRELPGKTAIICGEDLTALGILQRLREQNFSVPQDFAVTGFNNSIYSRCSTPGLTTLDSQSSAMGLAAARLCLDVLSGRQVPTLSTIDTMLITRESTGDI